MLIPCHAHNDLQSSFKLGFTGKLAHYFVFQSSTLWAACLLNLFTLNTLNPSPFRLPYSFWVNGIYICGCTTPSFTVWLWVSGCKCQWDIPAPLWLEALSISSLTRAQRSTSPSMNSSKALAFRLCCCCVCVCIASACIHMCVWVIVCAYVCEWVPVCVASMVSQSWWLVTVHQQGGSVGRWGR